jgi:cell division control protein 6
MLYILVLDEIDQLESKNQDVLYTVFEWPALASSRLALVGIANTLDLTDRVLPRLQVLAPAQAPGTGPSPGSRYRLQPCLQVQGPAQAPAQAPGTGSSPASRYRVQPSL